MSEMKKQKNDNTTKRRNVVVVVFVVGNIIFRIHIIRSSLILVMLNCNSSIMTYKIMMGVWMSQRMVLLYKIQNRNEANGAKQINSPHTNLSHSFTHSLTHALS